MVWLVFYFALEFLFNRPRAKLTPTAPFRKRGKENTIMKMLGLNPGPLTLLVTTQPPRLWLLGASMTSCCPLMLDITKEVPIQPEMLPERSEP